MLEDIKNIFGCGVIALNDVTQSGRSRPFQSCANAALLFGQVAQITGCVVAVVRKGEEDDGFMAWCDHESIIP
jgi:hypothetical protein